MTRFKSLMAIVLVAAVASCVALAGEVPFEEEWAESGHADAASESFVHWGVDPNIVSGRCAKCHSGTGFRDFIGADGSAVGSIDSDHPVGSLVDCAACHNSATLDMDTVTFPGVEPNYPGVTVTGLGAEARCMQCHQGRESTASVHEEIDDAGVVDDDTINSELGFQNVHYSAAGATQLGGIAMGGYQYADKMYDMEFAHVESADTCLDCHDPHTLEVKVALCADCHEEVVDHDDLESIRFLGSTKDYDGDGDIAESIKDEIDGIRPTLYAAIQAYASAQGTPIVYDSHAYPYWFDDTGSGFSGWTARLLKAAYNYQFSVKDHGAYVHNAKYVIQLMYDSIENLDPTLVAGFTRDDAGHFAGSTEPFRHWDEDPDVSSGCAKCHSAEGLPFFLETGTNIAQEQSNGLMCATCHDAVPGFTRHEVTEVEFPSGAVIDTGDLNSNLCASCHQGRQSTVSVNEAIAGLDLDTVNADLSFKNVHYYPAAGTLFGTQAKAGYEYYGKDYSGRSRHVRKENVNDCAECHDSHSLEVRVDTCVICHLEMTDDPRAIRKIKSLDYDGDGNVEEPLVDEIDPMHHDLYDAIQAYARTSSTPIIYASAYPYWFKDTNGNGEEDPGEATYGNNYNNSFTPRLLQACYNYQFVKKDPGGYAHNGSYVIQLLYDGIESLGGDVSAMSRPPSMYTSSECGDPTHPYPDGDINHDCRVDFLDMGFIGFNWLVNTNP